MAALRRRLLGLLALLLILGIVVGLPVVLLAVGANPLDAGLPSLDDVWGALTSPDDGTFAVVVIKVVAWIAWVVLTVSLVVEAFSRLRGVRVPRMRGFNWSQTAARGLVGTAILLFVAVPMANTASAAPSPDYVSPAMQQVAAQQVTDVAHDVGPSAEHAAVAEQHQVAAPKPVEKQAQKTVKHTVVQGESLWSIAQNHLGDGHRFQEIVKLNEGLLHGKASFIRAGWELTLPAAHDARAADQVEAHSVTVVKGDSLSQIAQDELGDASRYPEIFDASKDVAQPGGTHLTDPDVIDVGWTVQIPSVEKAEAKAPRAETPAPEREAPPVPAPEVVVPEAPAPEAAAPEVAMTQAADEQAGSVDDLVRTAGGTGALLAAGVLSLVLARRRTQQRLRRPGQRVPEPTPDIADADTELRVVADRLSVDSVDVALRALARACAEARIPLPSVRAARLTPTELDLYLAEPAALPAPWVGTPDQYVWRLDAARTRGLRVDRSTPAPYPALVTLGHDDEDGHVLLNLEQLGAVAVTGDERATREILAAFAVELAVSSWADDLQVTVVGAFPDLEDALRTGRVRSVPTFGRLLDDLDARADRDRRALADAGAPSLGAARAAGVAPDAWSPEVVLVAGRVTDVQRDRLARLATAMPRVAVAAITTGARITPWALELGVGPTAEHATLAPIGLAVRPQRLPDERYNQLLGLVRGTDVGQVDGWAVREPSLAEVETVPPVDEPLEDDDEATHVRRPTAGVTGPAPRLTVLGPVDLLHAGGPVEPSERGRLLELAAFVALHPGASDGAVAAALWPAHGTTAGAHARSVATSRLRRWMGTSADGDEYLPSHTGAEGVAFSPAVTSDVAAWDALLGSAPLEADPEDLQDALALVRGVPFHGSHQRRYAWAESLRARLVTEIVDASYELARRRILEGRWRAAERAVAVGLGVEPAQESLWRLRLLAAHQSRDLDTESAAIQGLLNVTERLASDLAPETAQLVAALQHPHGDFDRIMADSYQ